MIEAQSAAIKTSLSPIGTPSVTVQDSPSKLCELSQPSPKDFDTALLRITEHRDAHARYRTTIINKRQQEDLVQQNRTGEDEKYHASLVKRAQEDQQRRKTRTAEDRKLEVVERALEAQEEASFHISVYIISN